MTITVYGDVILPKSVVLAGVSGRQTRQNDRSSNQGGYATVNAVRDVTLREYTIGIKSMLKSYWNQIEAIWEITDSGAFGFLIEDPKGGTVTDGLLQGYMAGVESGSPGFGNGGPLYGLRQAFRAAGSSRIATRAATRTNGTPSLTRGGSPVTIGVAAGNASLSAAPVYVTFVADASQNVSAVTVGATTQVTLAATLPGLVIGGKLWLQDMTGADAALLNNLSHTITNISGGGLNVYTLSTNTAGKTITAAGTGKKYPQPDEALAWTGTTYVPVQFAEDFIDWALVRPGHEEDRLFTGPSIPLIEVREA